MYTLFGDTDLDMTIKEAREYGVKLISMPYVIGEEVTYPYKDSDEIDFHAFYDLLRKGVMPKTSALSPQEYIEYFEPEFKAGKDILYVHLSAAMSGTFNSMRLALNELKEKYPERKFYDIDTKGITINSYISFREICKMYKDGKSIEEIMKWAETEIDHFATYFYATDLKFFQRSGRVKGFAAFMGGLIGIRPIINMNADGIMASCGKARGVKNSFEAILNTMKNLHVDVNKPIVVGHSDSLEEANRMIELIKQRFGENVDITLVEVNPTTGAHCGPGGVGVAFYGDHR